MALRRVPDEAVLGASRRVQVNFTVSDTATAPTAGTITYRQIKPDGTDNGGVKTGWTNTATGVYYRDVDLDAVGTWKIKAYTTALSSHYAAGFGEIAVVDPMST